MLLGGDSVNPAGSKKSKTDKKAAKALLSARKKKKNPLMNFVIKISGLVFVVYCAGSIVMTQYEIAEKEQRLAELDQKKIDLQEQNDEYQSILSEEDEREYMERIAVDVLGYAYPTELRFYDTSRN